MDVSRAQDGRERVAFGFDHKMALRARFASIRRIRAGFLAVLQQSLLSYNPHLSSAIPSGTYNREED